MVSKWFFELCDRFCVALRGTSFELLIPGEGRVTFGRCKAAFFDLLLYAGTLYAVDFVGALFEELLEEGVSDALGVEGCVGVVVLAGLVACEEQHEFGQLVLADFGGESGREQADAVGQAFFAAAGCGKQDGDLCAYPILGASFAIEAVVCGQCGA